ncbi:hypothetical protein DY000_02013191 [Brassica cretica]|uniref:AT-hook motif nuclear-localized protein n=1 Tax=Brassica cretica TaxID=69181 RepID=A0ABQ7D5M4_BRACR|nr:hypothetical protein DY000_02013191 [Brassica cretica]
MACLHPRMPPAIYHFTSRPPLHVITACDSPSLLLTAKGACYGTIIATAPPPRFSTVSYEASILCHHRGRARAPPSCLLHQAQSSSQIKAQLHCGALPKSSPLRAQFHRRGCAHRRNQACRRGSK